MTEKIISVNPDVAIDVGQSGLLLSNVQVWVQPENWMCRLLGKFLKFTLKIQWVELPTLERPYGV